MFALIGSRIIGRRVGCLCRTNQAGLRHLIKFEMQQCQLNGPLPQPLLLILRYLSVPVSVSANIATPPTLTYTQTAAHSPTQRQR